MFLQNGDDNSDLFHWKAAWLAKCQDSGLKDAVKLLSSVNHWKPQSWEKIWSLVDTHLAPSPQYLSSRHVGMLYSHQCKVSEMWTWGTEQKSNSPKAKSLAEQGTKPVSLKSQANVPCPPSFLSWEGSPALSFYQYSPFEDIHLLKYYPSEEYLSRKETKVSRNYPS